MQEVCLYLSKFHLCTTTIVGFAVEIRGFNQERDIIMEVEKSLGEENESFVPLEATRSSKVQGVTIMARDGLNLNSHFSGIASSVVKGRKGVLYYGFQVQVCSFNPQSTINGKISIDYSYASYFPLPCLVFVHFHPSFLVNLLFLNHLVRTISDLQCIICLKGWLSHFKRCGVSKVVKGPRCDYDG